MRHYFPRPFFFRNFFSCISDGSALSLSGVFHYHCSPSKWKCTRTFSRSFSATVTVNHIWCVHASGKLQMISSIFCSRWLQLQNDHFITSSRKITCGKKCPIKHLLLLHRWKSNSMPSIFFVLCGSQHANSNLMQKLISLLLCPLQSFQCELKPT